MKTRFLPFVLALAVLLSALPSRAADDLYVLTREIPIGGSGGWDYLSIDPAGRRLYVAHATRVAVIDLEHDELLAEITGTPGVHGFALAPDLGRGFASDGRDGSVSVVDLRSLKTISKTPAGQNPDAILYEPGRREVYAFNGRSRSVTVLAAATGALVANIPLPGKPEFAAADPAAGRVYCNIEDKSLLAALDTATHTVAHTWPIAPGKEASGLAIDAGRHRLFIGCHNQKMVMLDAATGKVIDSIPIGQGVDACAFDPATRLAFASCGDGTTTIAREDGDKLALAQKLLTQRGARTMALDPRTHRIYLATAQFETPSGGDDDSNRRPRMIPNTLKILEYSMTAPPP